ncbi:hypothetical protein Scep_028691 [Stephania cephalantha]|uniref:Gnk2-homologous domain-containing protein n=1 Tax=Stephania cephalantha TaxID=152367 RepID=A0AAP0HJU8_9MAGN
MYFFRFTFLHLISFISLLHIVTCADPLFHFCSNKGNYKNNGPFDNNYKILVSSLFSQVPPTGFALDSTGQGEEVVNGLALCRGDIPSNDCKSCVIEASDEVRKRCEYNKGGVIWYDSCMLKYSNEKFFGTIDYGNRFYMWNLNNVSDAESFNMKTKELLSKLSAKASSSSKFYAAQVEEIGEAEKLFGLVQCTRDLTKEKCKKCLDDAIGELNTCCDGRRGGRVVGGSCNFRYELYPFFYSAN